MPSLVMETDDVDTATTLSDTDKAMTPVPPTHPPTAPSAARTAAPTRKRSHPTITPPEQNDTHQPKVTDSLTKDVKGVKDPKGVKGPKKTKTLHSFFAAKPATATAPTSRVVATQRPTASRTSGQEASQTMTTVQPVSPSVPSSSQSWQAKKTLDGMTRAKRSALRDIVVGRSLSQSSSSSPSSTRKSSPSSTRKSSPRSSRDPSVDESVPLSKETKGTTLETMVDDPLTRDESTTPAAKPKRPTWNTPPTQPTTQSRPADSTTRPPHATEAIDLSQSPPIVPPTVRSHVDTVTPLVRVIHTLDSVTTAGPESQLRHVRLFRAMHAAPTPARAAPTPLDARTDQRADENVVAEFDVPTDQVTDEDGVAVTDAATDQTADEAPVTEPPADNDVVVAPPVRHTRRRAPTTPGAFTPESQPTESRTSKPTSGPSTVERHKKPRLSPVVPLDEAAMVALQTHASLRDTYIPRWRTLWQQGQAGLAEEHVIPVAVSPVAVSEVVPDTTAPPTLPPVVLGALAAFIEGRSERLDDLASMALQTLQTLARDDANGEPLFDLEQLTLSSVTAQIQLLAIRQNYLRKVPPAAALETILAEAATTDSSNDLALWRWEVSAWTHLLPPESIASVKRARAARKRWSLHMAALAQLLAALNAADASLCDGTKSKRDALLAAVSSAEEKVVKLEREAVTHKLAEAARLQKAAAAQAQKEQDAQIKQKAQLEKQQAKERKKMEAEAAKERKKVEADTAKQQKKKETEAAKAARLAAIQAKEASEKAELARQKKSLRSFFAGASAKKAQPSAFAKSDSAKNVIHPTSDAVTAEPVPDPSNSFDSSAFRASISSQATDSMDRAWSVGKPRTKRPQRHQKRAKTVSIPVLVTVYPEGYEDNPFSAEQPYTEQQFVSVANKYKFLSFYENTRPAYYGTWSKRSTSVTGRTPWAQDKKYLNYEVDSEEEWEEEDANADDCEEGNRSVDSNGHDEEDGWLAADDAIEYDGPDEEAPVLQGRPMAAQATTQLRLAVSPYHGKPLTHASPTSTAFIDRVEGFSAVDAHRFLLGFTGIQLHKHDLFLDPFPPSPSDDGDLTTDLPAEKSTSMSEEALKVFARFVHNCVLGSKDKVVDEFLQAHKSLCNSRAQLYRTLDSIADKKRNLQGVIWQVKKDVLENLGLESLVSTAEQTVKVANQEAMKTIATFVHNNMSSSKEKLVDDLRAKHTTVTSSRADAMRIVQSIATKERHAIKGYFWSVKKEVLHELGLPRTTFADVSERVDGNEPANNCRS